MDTVVLKMARKTKPVKKGENGGPASPPQEPGCHGAVCLDGSCEVCTAVSDATWIAWKKVAHAPKPVATPKLVWEKMSYQHYVARGLGGARLEIVRSGRAKLLNYTWHPVVFGDRWASQREFVNLVDAQLAAEQLAQVYADRVSAAFADACGHHGFIRDGKWVPA